MLGVTQKSAVINLAGNDAKIRKRVVFATALDFITFHHHATAYIIDSVLLLVLYC